jgi:hypothetical protein
MKVVEKSAPAGIRVEKDACKPQKLSLFFREQYQLGAGLGIGKTLSPLGKTIFENLMIEKMVRENAAVRIPPAFRVKCGNLFGI